MPARVYCGALTHHLEACAPDSESSVLARLCNAMALDAVFRAPY